jgi:lysophospholipase L1-like esterase
MIDSRAAAGFAAMLACVLFACSNPITSPSSALEIFCPVAQEVESPDGSPIPITFAAPTTSGGSAPVSTSCMPVSGTAFATGTTTVSCSARDASRGSAACSFSVTVARIPELSHTRFLAFGDSITAGSLPGCPPAPSALRGPQPLDPYRDFRLVAAAVDSAAAYPTVLDELLDRRYRLQNPVVINEGLSGERVTDSAGGTNDVAFARLRTALTVHAPQVVLLMEGVNDINGWRSIPNVVTGVRNALRDFIREIRGKGAQVFVGTIAPEWPNSCRSFAVDVIPLANDAIRTLAVAENVPLVDIFAAFGTDGSLLGEDGLHPSPSGYQRIAETFFSSIRERLEVKF